MRPVIDFKVQGIHFYFDVREDVTKLCDNSGVGKSFLCYAIKVSLDTYKDTGKYPVKDKYTKENIKVKVVNSLEISLDELKQTLLAKDHLIIVDDADMVFNLHPELSNIILNNQSSMFILIAHSVIRGLPFGYREHAMIKPSKKAMKIVYYS